MNSIIDQKSLGLIPKYKIIYGNQLNFLNLLKNKSKTENFLLNNFDFVNIVYQIHEAYEKSLESSFENSKFCIYIKTESLNDINFSKLFNELFVELLGNSEPYKTFLNKIELEILEKRLFVTNNEFRWLEDEFEWNK